MMSKASFEIDRENLQVTATRVFDAPLGRVWRACSDPRLIAQWWPQRFMRMTVERMDFRVGGGWIFVLEDPKGSKYRFSGEYREIVEHRRMVRTFEMEAFPVSVLALVETLTFEEVDGDKTRLTHVSRFPSVEALEGVVRRGMPRGAADSWDRLAESLENWG